MKKNDFLIGSATKKPWGGFEQFCLNKSSTVKMIHVEQGKRLSLQYHQKRDELWVAIEEFIAQVGQEQFLVKKGEKIFIPHGVEHRIIAPENSETRVLEISFGEFDEEDIVRIQDDFGRVEKKKETETLQYGLETSLKEGCEKQHHGYCS